MNKYINAEEAFNLISKQIDDVLFSESSGAFSEIFLYLHGNTGKLFRSKFGILCCTNKKGLVDSQIVNPLCAIELLHLATLIHDDVIDDSPFRRGCPSVQAKFGKREAVLAGDYLFTICFSLVCSDANIYLPQLSRAMAVLCKGEMLQNKSLFCNNTSSRDYFKIANGKTAVLFSLCGAVGGGLIDKQFVTPFAKMGRHFGMAFQISDDICDILGTSQGKPSGNDLKSGIMTLPMIFFKKSCEVANEISPNHCAILKSIDICDRYCQKALASLPKELIFKKEAFENFGNRIMRKHLHKTTVI